MPTYLFEEDPVTCVSIETELGLNRGDVTQLNVYPSGAVEIETSKPLTTAKQTALKSILNARGLGHGKRPIVS